jgi:hypothetical protein
MITYTWTVTAMEAVTEGDLDNVVVISYFTCSGEEDGLKGATSSDCRLLPPDPANFIPLDQITEQEAVTWTLQALGSSGVQNYEEMVAAQIEGQKLPKPTFVELPWMSPSS